MRFAVLQFPGSNCDQDCVHVLGNVLGQQADYLWHKEESLGNTDAVVVPGGFSYGDYLRTGSIAQFSPVMNAVKRFANNGGLVIGICNGFQILCESGLLPGALMHNNSLKFESKDVLLRVERADTMFTADYKAGKILRIPIAHGEGNYEADKETLEALEAEGRVVFRYVNAAGETSANANPNGSWHNIAGITNGAGNVLGMMPHPERAMEELLGSTDGVALFTSMVASLQTS